MASTDAPVQVLDSWAPVDLRPYLRGEVERPVPTVGLARSDGLRLLYPGKEHAVIGEMESGKSWWCGGCAAAELVAGRDVVYVHFEECDPSDTVERLQALGVSAECILDRFHFVGPERRVSPDALDALLTPAPSLVIFDGVNEGMSLHGWDIRDEDGAAKFRRVLVKPCTQVGAATLAADHVVKDPERRGRTALGSVHKVNGLSGALIVLENADPFGRTMRGRSHVFIAKDRPGHLRRHGQPGNAPGKTYLGELVVDDTRDSVSYLDLQFWVPTKDPERPATAQLSVRDTVLAVVAKQPNQTVASTRNLFAVLRLAGHKIREGAVRGAVDDLVAADLLKEVPGRRGAVGYRLTAAQDQKESEP